jgi:hypothetical protein
MRAMHEQPAHPAIVAVRLPLRFSPAPALGENLLQGAESLLGNAIGVLAKVSDLPRFEGRTRREIGDRRLEDLGSTVRNTLRSVRFCS